MVPAVMTLVGALAFGQTPQVVPQPAGSRPSQTARPAPPPPATPAPASQQPAAPPTASPSQAPPEAAPTDATLGVPIFPNAQFIASYNAGRGQRYYIFGTAASFIELVAYYRTVLKQKGELVYEAPATQEFDVGKYNEDTMAFPPGVTIKDFQSD